MIERAIPVEKHEAVAAALEEVCETIVQRELDVARVLARASDACVPAFGFAGDPGNFGESLLGIMLLVFPRE